MLAQPILSGEGDLKFMTAPCQDAKGPSDVLPPHTAGALGKSVLPLLVVFLAALAARLSGLPESIVLSLDPARHQLFALECEAGGPCMTDLAILSSFGLTHGAAWIYLIQLSHWLGLSIAGLVYLLCVMNAVAVTTVFAFLRQFYSTYLVAAAVLFMVLSMRGLFLESVLWNASLLPFVCTLMVLSAYWFIIEPRMVSKLVFGAVSGVAVQVHLIVLFYFFVSLIILSCCMEQKRRLSSEIGSIVGLFATWLFMSPTILTTVDMVPLILVALLYIPARIIYSWMAGRFATTWPWRTLTGTAIGPLRLIALAWVVLAVLIHLAGGQPHYVAPPLVTAPILVCWIVDWAFGRWGASRTKLLRASVLFAAIVAYLFFLRCDRPSPDKAGIPEWAAEKIMDQILVGGVRSYREIEQHLWAGDKTSAFLESLLVEWRRRGRESAQVMSGARGGTGSRASSEICLVPEASTSDLSSRFDFPFWHSDPPEVRIRLKWRRPVLDLAGSWTCVSWDHGQECICRQRSSASCANAEVPAPLGVAWHCLDGQDFGQPPKGATVYQVFPIEQSLSASVSVWIPNSEILGRTGCRGHILGDSSSGVITGAPDGETPWTDAEIRPSTKNHPRLVVRWDGQSQACPGISSLAQRNGIPLPIWGESPEALDRLLGTSSHGNDQVPDGETTVNVPQSCELKMREPTPPQATGDVNGRTDRVWVRPIYVKIQVIWTAIVFLLFTLYFLRSCIFRRSSPLHIEGEHAAEDNHVERGRN